MKTFFIIIISFYGMQTFAANYPVSNIQEFNDAMLKAKAGDFIIWKDGSYADVKINFRPSAKGTKDQRITLRAETPGKVILTGNSQLGISGEYLQVEGLSFEGKSTLSEGETVITFAGLVKQDHKTKYSRVTNCAIINYNVAEQETENKWVLFYGTNNEFDHCSLIGKNNQGATVVVNYEKGSGYVDGSETAPSTFHQIHHNYFGTRTMPADNGGEHMRIGDSKTSFTKGFNITEYNYFEKHLLEPEVISNKSCDNIYRFNTFIANEGALVLRHGNRCIVYGNYFDGKNVPTSGGIRVIGENHTIFNNYLENLNSGSSKMKAPITIMSGVKNSALNGYFPANNAVIAYNTIVNSAGPIFRVGVGNKGAEYESPSKLSLYENLVFKVTGKSDLPIVEDMIAGYSFCKNNYYSEAGQPETKGFTFIKEKETIVENGLRKVKKERENDNVLPIINERLATHNISITREDATVFKTEFILKKQDTGASWLK